MFQLFVHFVRLFSHFGDFLFSRTDVSLEFFDFVVEDEFEFFQFLIFLLEFVNPLFFVSDSGVSLFALLFELLVVFALLFDLLLLVVDVVMELFLLIFSFVELLLERRQLLPHQVQLSLCFQ